MKQVSDLKTNVSAILTGIELDEVLDLYGSFERAVSTTIQKADVLEASGREPIMLYDGVTDYAGPETIFGGALIDIRPQGVERNAWDEPVKMPIVRFDQTKLVTPSGYKVTFEDRKGDLIMRIAQNYAQQKVQIDSMTDTDGWTLSGDGTGLALDRTVYYHQPGSLRFNLPAAGVDAIMTKTLDQTLDLSEYEGVGVAFLALYTPTPSAITAITLKIGSSPTDYYAVTVTEGFLGAFYANDFQLVAFDLAGVTAAGTPDMSEVDYVQIEIDYTGTAVPNIRLGDLFIALPSPHEVLFYSAAVFVPETPADAAAQTDITADTDTLLFRDAAYNIYVQEAAREVAKNQGGDVSSALIASIDLVLEGNGEKKLGLYQQYRGDNPSEELRQVGSYYDSEYPGNLNG
jgi:hypothetical protein